VDAGEAVSAEIRRLLLGLYLSCGSSFNTMNGDVAVGEDGVIGVPIY